MRENNIKGRGLKWFFLLFAILALIPWPVAYAYDPGNAVARQDAVRIEVAEPSAAPSWKVFGKAIGGVDTPGDLFYIDATKNPADIQTILYLTNTKELSHSYRYLILEVGVYVKNNVGEWEKASQWNGEPIPDTFVTLQNGKVSFTLMGHAEYKVTIDSGSFYCIRTFVDGGSVSPQFHLTVD